MTTIPADLTPSWADRIAQHASSAAVPQPDPTGDGEVVIDRVMEDLRERAEMGKQKYGTYLRTHNGRDALMDALQEALDLVMYLEQAIMEREASNGQ